MWIQIRWVRIFLSRIWIHVCWGWAWAWNQIGRSRILLFFLLQVMPLMRIWIRSDPDPFAGAIKRLKKKLYITFWSHIWGTFIFNYFYITLHYFWGLEVYLILSNSLVEFFGMFGVWLSAFAFLVYILGVSFLPKNAWYCLDNLEVLFLPIHPL